MSEYEQTLAAINHHHRVCYECKCVLPPCANCITVWAELRKVVHQSDTKGLTKYNWF